MPVPGVSVVIPTYNRADVLGEAVESALAQRWPDLEVVVVDDGSTDRTPELLERYREEHQGTLTVIRQENAGESSARNAGILASKHELVALLDSDNRFREGKLERQMSAFTGEAALDFSFTGYTTFGDVESEDVILPEWRGSRDDAIEQLLVHCCINTSTVLAKRSCLVDAGLFDESLRCCQDHDLWLRVAAAGFRIGYVAEPLTDYRIHDGAVSGDARLVSESTERVFQRLFDEEVLPPRFRGRREFYMARCYLNSASRYLDTGDGRAAAGALSRAARTRPASVRPGWARLWWQAGRRTSPR